jgi:superfamily II DNA or RNA helicase
MNKKPDYSYQDALVDRAYHELMLGNPTLLAACPGAGKTRMAIRIADRFKRKSPKSKILILTHGQTLLREQWGDVLEKHSSYNMAIVTPGIADFEIARADILVAIPQTLQFIKIDNWSIDLLIVDEAHHWYLSDAVQKGIVEVLKPNHTLLLTGSPSPYVGDPKWSIMGITVQELLEYGVLTDPVIELVESAYHFTMRDYRHNMNLKPDTAMGTDETDKTLDSILQSMIKKLVSADRISPEDYAWDNSWPRTLNKLSKTMFVCHTQSQAKDVAAYFDQRGVSYSLSISFENDGMDALTKFKTDKDCNVFIVVNRGTIGFDFDKLYNVVDMSATLNVNRLFQMLCRVVRRDMDNPDGKKLFIKVTSPEVKELTHFVMSFVVQN